MSLLENIKKLKQLSPEAGPVQLSNKVQETLTISKIDGFLEELVGEYKDVELEKDIIEGGERLILIAKWSNDKTKSKERIVLSVRSNTIAFIGSSEAGNNQFIRLSGGDLSNSKMVSETLAKTILNPFTISSK